MSQWDSVEMEVCSPSFKAKKKKKKKPKKTWQAEWEKDTG